MFNLSLGSIYMVGYKNVQLDDFLSNNSWVYIACSLFFFHLEEVSEKLFPYEMYLDTKNVLSP